MSSHASWLSDLVYPEQLQDKVQRVSSWIMNLDPAPVAIAVRGISGAVFGGAVSYVTGIPLVIVRKSVEITHSSHEVEYQEDQQDGTYVIVDDLVSSGGTIEAIQRDINESSEAMLLLGGVILYHQGASDYVTNQTYIRELMAKVPVGFIS